MRAMQCMEFRAKSAKNDLKPMDFLKCNFYFETEGVVPIIFNINHIIFLLKIVTRFFELYDS